MPVILNAFALHKKEKEGSVAVQLSKRKIRSVRGYKVWVRSLANAKRSAPSKQKETKISCGEVNVMEAKDGAKATNTDTSVSQSKRKRMDFLLRRVKRSSDVEKTNISNHATQTKQRKNNISESQRNVDGSAPQQKYAHSVTDERKSMTTNFVEYWVPVKLSNVQTEQYCGSLFSNSSFLCSSSKFDSKDFLHEMLVSARKCCDHPYLVDSSVRASLLQGIPPSEHLDTEIKLSSKLELLHKILLEINKRGLRVLILYQSLGGPGPISARDILDDIIHEKFGEDSFVRIDGRLSRSKRREVLNIFNDKKGGKFACLMETRACVPSIKLKSIDTVIFFNSDWDPMNDLRALQKINLVCQFEQVKVFRLYSTHTVEEKLLMLAKKCMVPEGNIVNLKRSTCQRLLTWGAYYLFEKLDEFHNSSSSDTNSVSSSYGDSFMEDVFLELSALLPNNDETRVCTNNSFILKVQQIGGIFPENISLLGEVEFSRMDNFALVEEMMDKEPPYVFWVNLIQGRKPRWKYFSDQSPKTRKCVQRSDDLLEAFVGTSTRCRTEAKRRSLSELQNRDKEREPPGETADQAMRQAALLRNAFSTETYSLLLSQLPPDDQMPSFSTNQNGHPQDPTGQLDEDVVRRPESCVEHATVEMLLKTSHIASSVSPSSLNCQPQEASHVNHSDVLQSVCKALQTELERLQKQKTEFLKQHEDVKLQARIAYEKEIDEIQKKYETALKNAELAFAGKIEVLETMYNKVFTNKSLAETMLQMENSVNTTLSQVMQERIASRASQSFPSPHSTYPVASPGLHLSARQLGPMHNLPTIFSGNSQTVYQMRAPAPHLRQKRHSTLPFTAPTLLSQSPENFYCPVSLRPMTLDAQTQPSLSCPSLSLAGSGPVLY